MVMPPGTLKFKCQNCSWSAIHHYKSDAISFFAPPRRCPRCGGKISSSKAGMLDKIFTPQLKHSESSDKERMNEMLEYIKRNQDKVDE